MIIQLPLSNDVHTADRHFVEEQHLPNCIARAQSQTMKSLPHRSCRRTTDRWSLWSL